MLSWEMYMNEIRSVNKKVFDYLTHLVTFDDANGAEVLNKFIQSVILEQRKLKYISNNMFISLISIHQMTHFKNTAHD